MDGPEPPESSSRIFQRAALVPPFSVLCPPSSLYLTVDGQEGSRLSLVFILLLLSSATNLLHMLYPLKILSYIPDSQVPDRPATISSPNDRHPSLSDTLDVILVFSSLSREELGVTMSFDFEAPGCA